MQILPDRSCSFVLDQPHNHPPLDLLDAQRDSPSLRSLISKKSSEHSRRKTLSSHVFRSIQFSMDYSYNCLPWYNKKRLVLQINELRKRLEFLLQDSHYTSTLRIFPSTIPQQLRGFYQHSVRPKTENVLKVRFQQDVECRGDDENSKQSRAVNSIFRSPKPAEEKENRAVFAAISKKRKNVLRVITKGKLNRGKAGGNESNNTNAKSSVTHRKNTFATSKAASSSSSSWYIRPSSGLLTEPAYCSMEMISFDKEYECFHRTEIAYPSRPAGGGLVSPKKEGNKNDTDDGGMDGEFVSSHRRLAKRLEIRSAAVNNIFKHSLIWD